MSEMAPPTLRGGGPLLGGGLASALSQAQGGGDQPDPLSHLQDAIENIHSLMVTLPDPQDVNNVAQCLRILTGIQQRLMTSGSSQAPPG